MSHIDRYSEGRLWLQGYKMCIRDRTIASIPFLSSNDILFIKKAVHIFFAEDLSPAAVRIALQVSIWAFCN